MNSFDNDNVIELTGADEYESETFGSCAVYDNMYDEYEMAVDSSRLLSDSVPAYLPDGTTGVDVDIAQSTLIYQSNVCTDITDITLNMYKEKGSSPFLQTMVDEYETELIEFFDDSYDE